jgi:hypothetical protein
MPKDCRDWCIGFHNDFHKGSGTNFLQKFDAIEDIFAHWQGYCTSKDINQRSPKYSTLLLEWANKTYEGRFHFQSANVIDKCHAARKKLIELGIWEDARAMFGKECCFNNKLLEQDVVILNIHSATVRLYEDFKDSTHLGLLQIFIIELFKFFIPRAAQPDSDCAASSKTRSVPWIFQKHRETLINLVATDMGEALVFSEKVGSKAKPKTSTSGTSE